MKNRVFRIFILILAVSLMVSAALLAGDDNDNKLLREALSKGGARLVDLQQPDGGWDWYVVGPSCGGSCPNLYGVTALGLLSAYKRTRDGDLLQAAIKTGDTLVAKFNAAPPGDGNPSTGSDRPFTQDVEFLVELAKKAHNKDYQKVATDWYARVIADFPVANNRVTQRINGAIGAGSATLAGWAIASDIRAAKATGNKNYARALATALVARSSEWDFDDPGMGAGWENFWRILSRGSMLWALHDLGNGFNDTIKAYRTYLLGLQEPGGSWGLGDTQVTSYVALGLSTVGGKGSKEAVGDAGGFLLSMQQAAGGFSIYDGTTDEITELDSEALQALARVHGDLDDD